MKIQATRWDEMPKEELMPGLTRLFGRFPGARIGTANLPAGIALNWAQWGRSPHYLCDERGQPLRATLLLLQFLQAREIGDAIHGRMQFGEQSQAVAAQQRIVDVDQDVI